MCPPVLLLRAAQLTQTASSRHLRILQGPRGWVVLGRESGQQQLRARLRLLLQW
jgi:hypothetical protein